MQSCPHEDRGIGMEDRRAGRAPNLGVGVGVDGVLHGDHGPGLDAVVVLDVHHFPSSPPPPDLRGRPADGRDDQQVADEDAAVGRHLHQDQLQPEDVDVDVDGVLAEL